MDRLSQLPLTLCAGSAGIAAGTTTTLTSARAISYSIGGKAYYKAAASNEATPTTDVVTSAAFPAIAVNYGAVVVVGRDSSGNLKAAQGPVEALDANGAFKVAPQFPAYADTVCPIGYIVVKVGSTGSAWTFGSSNLAGPPTGVTFSFQDVVTLPARPQIA